HYVHSLLFFLLIPRRPRSTLFPYTTLFRSEHVLRLALDQRLRGQHVLHFGGADAVRQRAESTVGGGVTVAAHDGHPWQGEALLGTDGVDDALPAVWLVVIFDAEIGGVLRQRLDLNAAFLVLDAEDTVGRGGHVVVDDGERLFRMAHGAA